MTVRALIAAASLGVGYSACAQTTTPPGTPPAEAPAPAAAAPSTTPAADAPKADPSVPKNPILILSSKGNVRYRSSPTEPWTEAKAGVVLSENAELRTGLNAIIQIQIADTQVLTVDRVSNIKLAHVRQVAGKNETLVELPYGRIKVDVDSTKMLNDVRVHAPDATLAVKGTTLVMEVTPGFPTATYGSAENTGAFVVTYADGRSATITGDKASDARNPNPADQASERTQVDAFDAGAKDRDETTQAKRSTGSGGEAQTKYVGADGKRGKNVVTEITPPDDNGGGGDGGNNGGNNGGGGTGNVPGSSANDDDSTGGPILTPNIPGKGQPEDLSGPLPIIDHEPVVPQHPPIFGIGNTKTEIFRGESDGTHTLLRNDVPSDPLSVFVNPAITRNENGSLDLYALVTSVSAQDGLPRNVLHSTSATDASVPWTHVGDFNLPNSQLFLFGLGAVGSDLYATGFDFDQSPDDQIFRLTRSNLSSSAVGVFPGVDWNVGAGGATDRGTLFVTGRMTEGKSSHDTVMIEYDPRTKYIANTWSQSEGHFNTGSDTFRGVGGAADLSHLEVVSGIAYSNGSVIITGAEDEAADHAGFAVIQFNPNATGSAGSPHVVQLERRVDVGVGGGLTGVPTQAAPAPIALSAATGRIDTQTISLLFSQMSYGSDTLTRSDVVKRIVCHGIAETSRDPAACRASAELRNNVGVILSRHAGQVSGVGQTVAEFRDSLPTNHPCMPANPGGG